MDPHATAHARKFAESRLHQIVNCTYMGWVAIAIFLRVQKAGHFPLIIEVDPQIEHTTLCFLLYSTIKQLSNSGVRRWVNHRFKLQMLSSI